MAKRDELSALHEKQVGLKKAIGLRQDQLERLQAELAVSETPATATRELCPA